MSLFRPLLDLVAPRLCTICSQPSGRSLPHLCNRHEAALTPLRAPFCAICAQPYDGAMDADFRCANCADLDLSFDRARAALIADDASRPIVHQLKYERQMHVARDLGRLVGELIAGMDHRGAALVPVPLHRRRHHDRTFNQAFEIARFARHICRLPIIPALVRTRHTEPQVDFDRAHRLTNLRGAFALRGKWAARLPSRVFLIDDVFTTGSTANECAKVLRHAATVENVVVATAVRG